MTANRKKPGVAFWATVVVVVVLVGYPLSWGPACWILWRIERPPWAVESYQRIYGPLLWVYGQSPPWIQKAIQWYCGLLT